MYATNGKKYLDFVQGIAVNCLGHALIIILIEQLANNQKVWHVSNVFTIPEQETF